MTGSPQLTPVPEARRIHALDVLRGIAVLGILGTNIQHFAMFAGTTRDPTLWGDLGGANFWVYAATYTLIYQKFLPIFAMLFGAGIVLSADRRKAAGASPAAHHYRRMGWLLAIGLVHAYLVWYGDILVTYALCGMIVFALRRVKPGLLIGLGILVLGIQPLIELLFFVIPALLGAATHPGGPGLERVIEIDLEAFRGTWVDNLQQRARYAFETQTQGLLFVLFWRASGLMLIGMALYRLRVLTGERTRRFYGTLATVAPAIALPITLLGLYASVATHWDNPWVHRLSGQIIYWFGIVMSLGWMGIVMLICRGERRPSLTRPFAAVGRMALTCYLLQSVICTFVFYGYGLGLYGRVERTGQAAVVAGVWLLLLVVSPIWLRYFRFGPAEWVWRSLTYGRLQPMVRCPSPE